MRLVLYRTYFPNGVNGEIWCGETLICYTIELPWKHNVRGVSCIPEGNYLLRKRFSKRFKYHLEIIGIPNRSYVLIHAANYALKELRGGIAPVKKLIGIAKGEFSRDALENLKQIVYPVLDEGEEVWLQIKERT